MKKNLPLATVFLAVLIDLMGFGIVLPLLPYYASAFGASPIAVGLLYSIYSLAQLTFSPIWGSFSDHIGRRPIMLLSTLGATGAYLLFAFANNFTLLFLSRLIAGVMGGNISTAQAYVADVTTPEERTKGMGLIGAAFGIGFALGPALAAVLTHPGTLKFLSVPETHKYLLPGFFAAILSFTSFLLVLFKLPETVQRNAPREPFVRRAHPFTPAFWRSLSEPGQSGIPFLFMMLVGSVFLISFAHSSLYSAFPLYCHLQLRMSADQVGLFFALMGLIAILIQGGFIRVLARAFGEKKLLLFGSVLMVAGFAVIPLAPTKSLLVIGLCVLTVGVSLCGPTLNSLVSKEAHPSRVGATLGTSQGISALGRVLGPTLGGFLYGISHPLPFWVTAVLLCPIFFVGLKLHEFPSVR